jgi:flavin-dependent dehydrogenase
VRIGIIGGSISGLEAAIQLSKDYEVHLFEEHKEIGEPLKCAEGWAVCMGIEPYIKGRQVEKTEVVLVDDDLNFRKNFTIPSLGFVEMIDRPKMERKMAKIAERRGCQIYTGNKVKIRELVDHYDILIDASGYPSQWCREFGGKRRAAIAVESITDYECETLTLALYPRIDGYFWVFPKAAGGSNIGVGYFKRHSPIPLRRLLDKFLSKIGARSIKYTSGLIGCILNRPFVRIFNSTPVALVGDAAGIVDVFVGEGMTKAVISSRILSNCIHKGKLNEYEKEYLKKMRKYYTLFNIMYFKRCRMIPLVFSLGKLGIYSALFKFMKFIASRDMAEIRKLQVEKVFTDQA